MKDVCSACSHNALNIGMFFLKCESRAKDFLTIVFAWFLIIPCSTPLHAAPGEPMCVIMTADTEGQVQPCQDCPGIAGLGGLARRATTVARLQKENRSMLLVDAGNTIFGAESIGSRGEVIVSAYNALGYDALNLSYRDFRLGKETTLALLKDAQFTVLSANLLDDKTGKPLAQPYVVKRIGDERIALIGLTQRPAGLDYLPHLKEQLAGIRIQSPSDALRQCLPNVKAQSDAVILVYYGSAAGIQTIHREFGKDLSVVLVGGSKPEYLPSKFIPSVIGTYPRGQHLVQARFEPDTGRIEVSQLAVEPTIEPDPEMQALLAPYLEAVTWAPSRPLPDIDRKPSTKVP